MARPPLWTIEHGRARICILGAAPLTAPWSSRDIEKLVVASNVFWNEVPEMGADAQQLALKYGVDPAQPLATWLTPDDLARVEAAAATVNVSRQLLAPLRPWLAAQVLKIAADAQSGLRAEFAVESHLASLAERAGVPVRSEYATPEDLLSSFASWPREAEIQRLQQTLAEIEGDIASNSVQSEAWSRGDLSLIEATVDEMKRNYAVLYEHLVVRRNLAWVRRIDEALGEGESAFFCVGSAHLVGADAILVMLDRANIAARPV